MTPTASSSSILLLNPAAQSGSTIAATEAQAAPGEVSSGFELLLGAMQQLQQELSTTMANGNSESDSAPSDDEQNGNGLPQLGMLLPVSGKVASTAGDVLPTDIGTDKKTDKKECADDIDSDSLLFNALQSAPVFANNSVFASSSASSTQNGVNSTQNSIGEIAAVSTADELASQMAAISNHATNKEAGSTSTDRNAVSLKLGTEFNRVAIETANNADTNALAQDVPDVAPASESDFDILVKHFDTSSTPQLAAAPASIGDSSAVNHASRAYSNAVNSNAAVPVPVGGEGWGDAIADKVMWFSANKVNSAEIHLNPPDLGPLQVRVSTQQDQASVVFTSQHAAVRDALDQALPRLRDMMGSQGMQLLDVSVGGQNSQQQQQQFTRNNSSEQSGQFVGFIGDDTVDTKNANVTPINTARLLRSGVDAYA